MGAVLVVVLEVAVQDANKVLAADNQEAVKARLADSPDPTLGDGVGVGHPIGVQMISAPVERQTSLNALMNLVSRSRIRNRNAAARSQLNQEIAGLLDHSRASRVSRDTSHVHPPAAQFDDEQHIQSSQPDGLDSEEVASHDVRRLSAQQ